MKCVYDDEKHYAFHAQDNPSQCFLCSHNSQKLFIVRQISSSKMVHLCGECMLNNTSEYLLDNTRPWEGDRGSST